jgi:hypothetical protein
LGSKFQTNFKKPSQFAKAYGEPIKKTKKKFCCHVSLKVQYLEMGFLVLVLVLIFLVLVKKRRLNFISLGVLGEYAKLLLAFPPYFL